MEDILKVNPHNLTRDELIKLVLQQQKKLQTKTTQKKSKKSKTMDWSKYTTKHIALKIGYIGWNYACFASLQGKSNTIEDELFKALEKVALIKDRNNCNYSRCGRTDRGVSALGQVVALDMRWESKGVDYMNKLNSVLPPDIRVLGWAEVNPSFNARFDCLYRTYKYFFFKGDKDVELMRKAAKQFIGSHDFRNFCKIDYSKEKLNFERKILSVEIQKANMFTDDLYEIVICGYAFLWHQVRCMVAVLFLVGEKKEKPDIISQLLNTEKYPAKPQYDMASELPLILYDCGFDGIRWQHGSADSQKKLEDSILELLHQSLIKSALLNLFLKECESAVFPDGKQWKDYKKTITFKQRRYQPLLQRPTGAIYKGK